MKNLRLLAGTALGIAIGFVATVMFEPLDRSINIGEAPQGAAHPLQTIEAGAAVVQSGTPNFRLAKLWVPPDGRTTTGIWAADGPTTFTFTYSTDETVYVLDGRAEVDYQGKHLTLDAGTSARFLAGTTASWHVPVMIRKVYEVERPNRATRWWNDLVHPSSAARS